MLTYIKYLFLENFVNTVDEELQCITDIVPVILFLGGQLVFIFGGFSPPTEVFSAEDWIIGLSSQSVGTSF